LDFDVFVSYSSKDKPVADAVCARLEAAGIRCWIAPRDVLAGTSYGQAIIEAIHAAKLMVLVFSSNANSSGHIPKEVERAVSRGLAILPFRIEDVTPGDSLDYFIGSVHWLDAITPPLEKHLDALAATVRKLLPVRPGEKRDKRERFEWDRKPPIPPPSKTIWIGLAAVALLALIGIGVALHRGGGDAKASLADPIVGCYQWFNNAPVLIRRGGTMVAGPFTAQWRLVSGERHAYTFTWPEATDTVTISPDQQSLSGANQYGYPTSGTRIAGDSGLVGVWRWPNGVPVNVSADGTFTAATFRGRWQTSDASRDVYTLTWPNPVDSVTLSADNARVDGMNQYGVAISGVRTAPCSEQ
jgi:hypothetical protein